MKNYLRKTGCLAVVAASVLMMACAKDLPELPMDSSSAGYAASPVVAAPAEIAETTPPLEAMATDLVSGLSYISGMTPNLTSIKTPARNSEFDELVKASMVEKGYTFDDRYDRAGSERLSTSFLQVDRGPNTSELIGIISINSIFVKRTYLITDSGIEPKTAYMIKGISPQLVQASDQVRVL